MKIELNDDQYKAVVNALTKKFTIITGGAGTGKTTLIKELVNEIKDTTLICAPTGKAAARLREATGMEASTIHALLKFTGERFLGGNLHGKSLIVDESSMIDSVLMAEIVKRKPKRLVLIGDFAQLPPVGNGAPFHDLIKMRPNIVTNLRHCYRSSEAVFRAGTLVRQRRQPVKVDSSDNEYWEIRHTGTPEKTQELVCDIVRAGKIDFQQDIILCCRNGDRSTDCPGTVHGFNKAILNVICPGRNLDNERWRVGDRIICHKNFSKFDIWNGTTGTITGVNDNELWVKGDIPFWDEDAGEYISEIKWDKEVKKECQHAYTLTVHKSQGSQYRNVIFCCFSRDTHVLLSNSLIYTAITRTQKNCLVVGSARAFYNGIDIKQEKRTVLQELEKSKEGK